MKTKTFGAYGLAVAAIVVAFVIKWLLPIRAKTSYSNLQEAEYFGGASGVLQFELEVLLFVVLIGAAIAALVSSYHFLFYRRRLPVGILLWVLSAICLAMVLGDAGMS